MSLYFIHQHLYSWSMRGALSSKGQVTIPKAVRDALGLRPGDLIEFSVRGDEIVGRRRGAGMQWSRMVGVLDSDRTTDDVMRELRPERAW
jgi:antitoxin PrlF